MPYKDPEKQRQCNLRYNKAYYRRTKAVRIRQIAERRRCLGEFVTALKRDKPCMDCKQVFHPKAMDFDHRDPKSKRKSVAQLVRQGVSEQTLLKEIAKCDLVCAVCHRVRHLVDQV